MTEKASALGGKTAWVAGIVVAMGVSAFALVATGVLNGPAPDTASDSAPQAVAPAPKSPAPSTAAAPKQAPEKTAVEAPKAAPTPEPQVAQAPVSEPETAPAADPVADPVVETAADRVVPSFDVVRVDAEGNTVIAGAAAPHADLAILLDGIEVAIAPVDGTGQFAAILSITPSDAPRVLSLLERRQGGDVASDATVIVAPVLAVTAPVVEAPAEVVPDTETKVATATAPALERDVEPAEETPEEPPLQQAAPETVPQIALTEPAPTEDPAPEQPTELASAPAPAEPSSAEVQSTQEQPAPTTTTPSTEPPAATAVAAAAPEPSPTPPKPPARKAPAVIVSDAEGLRVLQPAAPADTSETVRAAVSIDSISYTDTGAVMVSGHGGRGLFVRLYLNNDLAAQTSVDDTGMWSSQLSGVAGGFYEMRVDEVDGSGKVTSRVLTPFKRETPETVARARAQADATAAALIAPETTPAPAAPQITSEAPPAPSAATSPPATRPAEATPQGETTASITSDQPAPQPVVTEKAAAELLPKETAPVAPPAITAPTDLAVATDPAVSPEPVAAAPQTPPAAPETPAAPGAARQPAVQIVTVQPGSTLWAIARDNYGEGLMYLRVFEANKEKILNPDLIYPGQVFTVPEQ